MKKIAFSRLRALLFQALVMLFFSALAAFAPLLWPPFKIILLWILLPILGALTSGLLAFSGVSCYAAWILPPVIVSALPWLLLASIIAGALTGVAAALTISRLPPARGEAAFSLPTHQTRRNPS